MQKVVIKLICALSTLFFAMGIEGSNQSSYQNTQFNNYLQDFSLVTQAGQSNIAEITTVSELQKAFNKLNITNVPIYSFPLTSGSTGTGTELSSIAFGGYTFISNYCQISSGVSANIIKDLYPAFQKMVSKKNLAGNTTPSITIHLGLFGIDSFGDLLATLDSDNNTNQSLYGFKFFIFDDELNLIGTEPITIPLNNYYSCSNKMFGAPTFSSGGSTNETNVTDFNFVCTINKIPVPSTSSLQYPYMVKISNISGINIPNRDLTMQELLPLLFPGSNNVNNVPTVYSNYETLQSLEINIGNLSFSFLGTNQACVDIYNTIKPYLNSGINLVLAAVDTNDSIVSGAQLSSDQGAHNIDHYLLYVFDKNYNKIEGFFIDPACATTLTGKNPQEVTVLVNGKNITIKNQSYPLFVNLTYGSGISLSELSSVKQISLKDSQTLSDLSYTITSLDGTHTISLKDSTQFGSNWLDMISGQRVFIRVQQIVYQQQYEIVFEVYGVDVATKSTTLLLEQAFGPVAKMSGLSVSYQTNISKAPHVITPTSLPTPLDGSWIEIIPSVKKGLKQPLTSALIKKQASNYQVLKFFLSNNYNFSLLAEPVTSNITSNDVTSKTILIPGWYDSLTKQYQYHGFRLQLSQMKSGDGYFFLEDSSQGTPNTSVFANNVGVSAITKGSSIESEIANTIVKNGTCTMALFAFDAVGNYISNILDPQTPPDHFELYIFDSHGNNLPSSPVSFSSNDYVGLGNYQLKSNSADSVQDSANQAIFYLDGLGLSQQESLTYPFAFTINWTGKAIPSKRRKPVTPMPKPTPKPTPKPKPTPTPSISYSSLQALSLSLLQKSVPLNSANVNSTLPSLAAIFPPWNLNLQQIKGGLGYAFIQNTFGVGPTITNVPTDILNNTIICKGDTCSQACSMVLLAFDKKNNYMNNILDTNNPPKYFALFMYDEDGNILSEFPITFDANANYIAADGGGDGYKVTSSKAPAQFLLSGLGLSSSQTLTYPFCANITLSKSSSPIPKPTPSPATQTSFTMFAALVGLGQPIGAGNITKSNSNLEVALKDVVNVTYNTSDNSTIRTVYCDIDGVILIEYSSSGSYKLTPANNVIQIKTALASIVFADTEYNNLWWSSGAWKSLQDGYYILRYNTYTFNAELYNFSSSNFLKNLTSGYYNLITQILSKPTNGTQTAKSLAKNLTFYDASSNKINITLSDVLVPFLKNSLDNGTGFYMIPVLTDQNGFYISKYSQSGTSTRYLQLYFVDKQSNIVYPMIKTVYTGTTDLAKFTGFGVTNVDCLTPGQILFTNGLTPNKFYQSQPLTILNTALNSQATQQFYLVMTDTTTGIPYYIIYSSPSQTEVTLPSNAVQVYEDSGLANLQGLVIPNSSMAKLLDTGIAFSLITENNKVYLYVQDILGNFVGTALMQGLTSMPSQVTWSGAYIGNNATVDPSTTSVLLTDQSTLPISSVNVPSANTW